MNNGEKCKNKITINFTKCRFSFEILINDILYAEPVSKESIVIEVSDPMNIKIRVLEYRYGRLRYSDVILNVNVLPEDAPISITVHDTFAKIESD